MSKEFKIICDMCKLTIEPEEHATVRIIRKFGLKSSGRPTAQQERTYDIHISCLQAAKVPVPSGDVRCPGRSTARRQIRWCCRANRF